MKKYNGYTEEDYTTDYAQYYNEKVQPVSSLIQQALKQSPLSAGRIPAFSDVTTMHQVGYADVETGFTMEQDGAAHVAVLTTMPTVTPVMWDWWFAWHGCAAARYKLWHPKSHIDAHWQDGKDDLAYIGRTSMITEYIGKSIIKGAIQFVSPRQIGFPPEAVQNTSEAVYICARLSHARLPIDFGWLVHQVRAVEGGSEMRSRFWLGGSYIRVRKEDALSDVLSRFIRKIQPVSVEQAQDILIHCSEEMNHLASFLPEIYSQCNPKSL